jgi:hypothetical protein
MPVRASAVNDCFVVDEAIAFAIEGMSRLPNPFRPEGKIADLKMILNERPQAERRMLLEVVRRRIDELLGVLPSAQI